MTLNCHFEIRHDVTIQMKPFLASLPRGTICFSIFYKTKFWIFLEF